MIIDCFVLGDFQTNCFIIKNQPDVKSCILIDPGLNPAPLISQLKEKQIIPMAVLLTHGHIDHIGGLPDLLDLYPDMKTYIHAKDANMLTHADLNLSMLTGNPLTISVADSRMEDGQTLSLLDLTIQIIHTPGHTPGGTCFYLPDQDRVFAGDTLFCGSIGRTDFPGGNMSQLLDSIRQRLLVLPDQTRIYCGHGPETTIGREKRMNPFLT